MRRPASCLLALGAGHTGASKQLAGRLYATKLLPSSLTPGPNRRFVLSFLLFFLLGPDQFLVLLANLFARNQQHGDRFEFLQRGRGLDVDRRIGHSLIGQIFDPSDQQTSGIESVLDRKSVV